MGLILHSEAPVATATSAKSAGWYLMMPPVGIKRSTMDTWDILKTFDSEKQCQDARDKELAVADGSGNNSPIPMLFDTTKSGVRAEAFNATAAQCIATDDPRLKGK
jgi:hypothetical protein